VSGRATAHCAASSSRIQYESSLNIEFTINIEFTMNQANIELTVVASGAEPGKLEGV